MKAENSQDLDQERQRNKKGDDSGADDADLHKGGFARHMNTKGFVVVVAAAAHFDPFLNAGRSNTPGDEPRYSEDTSWQAASKVHEPHRKSISSRSATERTDILVL